MTSPNLAQRVLICRSNPVAPDPRVEKEARALVNAGYPVAVIGWDRSASLPVEEESDGFTIHRIPLRAEYGSGLMNLPNLLRWQAALFFWLYRHRAEYDLIHACDFDTILPALWARRYWGKKVVYDIFDFYADHLRRTPQRVKDTIRRLDMQAIDAADAVILCDDARRQQISGAHPRQLAVIYNTPEDRGAGDAELPAAAAAGEMTLAYIGLIQVERGLSEMLAVLSHHPEWRLDLAGFGGDEDQILAQARLMPNVTWHGRVPYEVAIQLSRAADVLFALYDPAIPNHRYASPNKVFEALMLGKPLIVAAGTNMDELVSAAGCGLIVPYGDIPTLEAALLRLAADPALRHALGARARRAYDTGYSWAVMERRLLELYRGLLA